VCKVCIGNGKVWKAHTVSEICTVSNVRSIGFLRHAKSVQLYAANGRLRAYAVPVKSAAVFLNVFHLEQLCPTCGPHAKLWAFSKMFTIFLCTLLHRIYSKHLPNLFNSVCLKFCAFIYLSFWFGSYMMATATLQHTFVALC